MAEYRANQYRCVDCGNLIAQPVDTDTWPDIFCGLCGESNLVFMKETVLTYG